MLSCWNVVCDHADDLRLKEREDYMAGKGRQMPRKPATKFAHLRKKMEKARIAAKISKKKVDRRP